jgi:hypothetical protein
MAEPRCLMRNVGRRPDQTCSGEAVGRLLHTFAGLDQEAHRVDQRPDGLVQLGWKARRRSERDLQQRWRRAQFEIDEVRRIERGTETSDSDLKITSCSFIIRAISTAGIGAYSVSKHQFTSPLLQSGQLMCQSDRTNHVLTKRRV